MKIVFALVLAFVLSTSVAQAKQSPPNVAVPLCYHYGDSLQYQFTVLAKSQAIADALLASSPTIYTAGFCPSILP